jgi:hypothetical protein
MSSDFLTIGFDSDAIFVDPKTGLSYDGLEFELVSGGSELHHNLCIPVGPRSVDAAFRAGSRFLNEVCWFRGPTVLDLSAVSGNRRTRITTRTSQQRFLQLFVHDFQQSVAGDEQHLALGFFREGFSAESPFYRFLSYMKVIDVHLRTGLAHIQWINSHLEYLQKSKYILQRLARRDITDVGQYLWVQCRNALAHGDHRAVIDISNYELWQDIVWASELMREIAEAFIVQELGLMPRDR